MGVPVITLAGRTHVSRVGASLLDQCGLQGFVAECEQAFVDKVVSLARDTTRLVALRREFRATVAAAGLRDPGGFAKRIEAAYRDMWQRRCESAGN
jgi:protein O-GlcNAc transferase